MHLTAVIIVFFFYQNLKSIEYEDEQKQCTCECCLDDNENCTATFRSAVNINPLIKCNNQTCKQELCLTFSQCSTAFGKTEAICSDIKMFSSAIIQTTFRNSFVIIVLIFKISLL